MSLLPQSRCQACRSPRDLSVDSLTGEPVSPRRPWLRALGGAAMGGAIAAIAGLAFRPYHPARIPVSRWTLPLPGLPPAFEGLRIVHLSDLHYSRMVSGAYLEQCVQQANDLAPNVVFLTGDFVSSIRGSGEKTPLHDLGGMTAILARLAPSRGCFAVLGNHDVAAGAGAVASALEQAGIRVLRDESVFLEKGGDRLAVVGLRDLTNEFIHLGRAFSDLDPAGPVLVLMHQPDLFETWEDPPAGIAFSGHTHGGQVCLPGYGPLNVIPSSYGKKYAEGLFRRGDFSLLVNRGLGVVGVPFRFHCPPEIGLIVLEAGTGLPSGGS